MDQAKIVDQTRDKAVDQTKDKAVDQTKDKAVDQTKDKAVDQTRVKAVDQTVDQDQIIDQRMNLRWLDKDNVQPKEKFRLTISLSKLFWISFHFLKTKFLNF